MTTKFVGASGKNGREREVIIVEEGMTVTEVMAMFKCDRHTAKDSIKRGFYIVNFHKRTIYPGPLDTESAYKLAWFIYRRKYEDRLPWYVAPEDLVQEGVLRLFEMAGHPRFQEKGFQFYLGLNAMKGWIERQRRMRGGIGGTTPGYEETWRRDAANDWHNSWQSEREESSKERKENKANSRRAQAAKEKIVQEIFQAGDGISRAELGRFLGVTARVAQKKVARAMAAGLVENVGSATHHQGQAIRLTARGRALIDAAV
jgi:DNA-directed RNA polymerase specialized sigma24 family protein/DNA-binding CsgD family transcriptional regulator